MPDQPSPAPDEHELSELLSTTAHLLLDSFQKDDPLGCSAEAVKAEHS